MIWNVYSCPVPASVYLLVHPWQRPKEESTVFSLQNNEIFKHSIMILSFLIDRSMQKTQIRLWRCLIRVYTVCHSVCIFWMHYSMVKPPCSNFRGIKANVLSIQTFRILMVNTIKSELCSIHWSVYMPSDIDQFIFSRCHILRSFLHCLAKSYVHGKMLRFCRFQQLNCKGNGHIKFI